MKKSYRNIFGPRGKGSSLGGRGDNTKPNPQSKLEDILEKATSSNKHRF